MEFWIILYTWFSLTKLNCCLQFNQTIMVHNEPTPLINSASPNLKWSEIAHNYTYAHMAWKGTHS